MPIQDAGGLCRLFDFHRQGRPVAGRHYHHRLRGAFDAFEQFGRLFQRVDGKGDQQAADVGVTQQGTSDIGQGARDEARRGVERVTGHPEWRQVLCQGLDRTGSQLRELQPDIFGEIIDQRDHGTRGREYRGPMCGRLRMAQQKLAHVDHLFGGFHDQDAGLRDLGHHRGVVSDQGSRV